MTAPGFSTRQAAHVAIALVSFTFGLALFAGDARSASHRAGVIAFVRADGIYAMDVKGAHVHPLMRVPTGAPVQIRWLAWSPDGKKLAYWMRHQIWVMNADGTHNVALVGRAGAIGLSSSPLGPTSPTWSPDGKWIAFTTDSGWPARGESRALWVMHADAGGMHRVAEISAPYPAVELAWSPSGKQFVFTRWLWGEGASALYLMDANGAHQPSYKSWLSFGRAPAWSPDARRIAFTYSRANTGIQIALINPNGRHLVRLTTGGAFSFDPSWSPDGRQIAFAREPATKNSIRTLMAGSEIYVMNADGTNVRRLTNNKIGEASPAWQPTP